MNIDYSHNNSGGKRWIKLPDWLALEAAGWVIDWGGVYFCRSDLKSMAPPPGMPQPCAVANECPGHRKFDSADAAAAGGGIFLGELAWAAHVERETPCDAMREFEKLTGQDVSEEGCNCCGPPHGFSWKGDYASGERCLQYLFPGKQIPSSMRAVLEASTASGGAAAPQSENSGAGSSGEKERGGG